MEFKGSTFIHEYDYKRLTSQLERVKYIMLRGGWHTLESLKELTGGSITSLSARIRQLRNSDSGGYIIERRRRGEPKNGLHEYHLLKHTAEQQSLF